MAETKELFLAPQGKGNLDYEDVISKLTYKKDDAKKLLIRDKTEISDQYGHLDKFLIGTIDIGTGENSQYRVLKETAKQFPITQGDVILPNEIWECREGYSYLVSYRKKNL